MRSALHEKSLRGVEHDHVECEKCDNGKCKNEFPTGERAIKLHMNWMGVLLCTDFKESEEYIEMKNEVTE